LQKKQVNLISKLTELNSKTNITLVMVGGKIIIVTQQNKKYISNEPYNY